MHYEGKILIRTPCYIYLLLVNRLAKISFQCFENMQIDKGVICLCNLLGLYTGLTPLYLTEIATADIRGALGTLHQLGVTIGIFLSQILGFPEIFGNGEYWHVLLGMI